MSKQLYTVTKKIDNLGRVCIPKEYRKILNINDRDIINLSIVDNKIEITKYFDCINYENEIKKYLFIKYGIDYVDYLITSKDIETFEKMINQYLESLIDR